MYTLAHQTEDYPYLQAPGDTKPRSAPVPSPAQPRCEGWVCESTGTAVPRIGGNEVS
jgi:hypothetical protein